MKVLFKLFLCTLLLQTTIGNVFASPVRNALAVSTKENNTWAAEIGRYIKSDDGNQTISLTAVEKQTEVDVFCIEGTEDEEDGVFLKTSSQNHYFSAFNSFTSRYSCFFIGGHLPFQRYFTYFSSHRYLLIQVFRI